MRNKLLLSPVLAAGLAFGQSDVIQLRVPAPPPGAPGAPNVIYFNHSADANLGTMEFVRSEFGSGAVVKGAPYTADAVTESVQVLQDGNRIVHRDTVTLARDGEGRTRRDMTMPAIPGMSASDAPKFSFLFDPATNTSYTLNHNTRTATRSNGRSFSFQFTTKSDSAPGTKAAGGMVMSHDMQMSRSVNIQRAEGVANGVRVQTGGVEAAKNSRTESLGKQNIDGLAAEGTRTVTTIEAGAIGNERPIEIVSERWYSPELQTVVMSKHSDPRSGETTYKLTNVRREEPAKSLFEVPAGYNVDSQENKVIRFRQPGPKE